MSRQPPVLLFTEVLRDSLLLGFVMAQSPAAAAPLFVSCMNPIEKTLSKVGLWVSIAGAGWALLILLATGMSNVADEARRQTLVAFPPSVFAFAVSVLGLSLAYRRGTTRVCARNVVPALAVSGGTIALIIAALRTYK